mgnify:CR=1 FL=1
MAKKFDKNLKLDYKKVINYIFRPKKFMSDEELKMKKLKINTSYYNSLTKAEKQFYWFFIFVLNFLVIFGGMFITRTFIN